MVLEGSWGLSSSDQLFYFGILVLSQSVTCAVGTGAGSDEDGWGQSPLRQGGCYCSEGYLRSGVAGGMRGSGVVDPGLG